MGLLLLILSLKLLKSLLGCHRLVDRGGMRSLVKAYLPQAVTARTRRLLLLRCADIFLISHMRGSRYTVRHRRGTFLPDRSN